MKKNYLSLLLIVFAINFSFAQSPIYTSAGYGANYSTDGAYLGWNISGGGGETNFVNNIGGGNIGGFTFDNTTRSNAVTHLMSILGNGNIGIGTTSPTYKLDVNGAVHSIINSGSNIFLSKAAGASIQFDNGSGVQTALVEAGASDNHLEFWTNTATNTGIIERMRITNNGSLAIGTTDPKGYMLAVNGSAISTSMTVKLNSNWPDYVFKKEYRLPSLAEVKTYIDLNHHLPDMPSEQEVIKEGINLGEMNKLLTKKVEELTLYLIEKDETEKQQQEKISSQEERISKLEQSLEQLLKRK